MSTEQSERMRLADVESLVARLNVAAKGVGPHTSALAQDAASRLSRCADQLRADDAEIERLRAEVEKATMAVTLADLQGKKDAAARLAAERQLAELRENTEASQVKCLVDIRWAVGDKGKLMQDELVEHIKGIVAERDSLRERIAKAPVIELSREDWLDHHMQVSPSYIGKRVRLVVEDAT